MSEEQYTVCSNMHCYKKAKVTGVYGKPPFCRDHIEKARKKREAQAGS